MSEALQLAGGLAAAAAAAAAILVPQRRVRAAAMAAALMLVLALVAGEAWEGELGELRDAPLKLAAILLVGSGAVGALALLGARLRSLVPLALIAALPFRIPIDAGAESSNLLLPLYLVIAAAVALECVRAVRAEEDPVPKASGGAVRGLGIVLSAALLLYAAQAIYSSDVSRAAQNLGFFLVPFAVMFTLLRDAAWTPRLLRFALIVIVLEAVAFAIVGVVQHQVGEIFWNDKLMRSNEFDLYFRTNSLFWDPNIYGRYLALSIVIGAAALARVTDLRRFALGTVAIAVVFAGMVFAHSQTSFISLLAGLIVLFALRWSLRWTLGAGAVALLAAAVFILASPDTLTINSGSGGELEQTTSGRSRLAGGGLDLARERPLGGHGSGSFAVEFARRNELGRRESAISHTEPITVAAEQGAVGALLYVALIVSSLAVAFGGLRRLAPGLGAPSPPPGASTAFVAARIAVAAAFAGLLIHTAGYAGFLTDPLSWALLALATALAADTSPAET